MNTRPPATTVPVVRVQHEGFADGVLINADEFDAMVHVRFEQKPEPDPIPSKPARK
jgi:hypothetical protein